MRSPLLSAFNWRDAIDTFCISALPEVRSLHSCEVATYLRSDDAHDSLWQTVSKWCTGGKAQALELSKPLHFINFHWTTKSSHVQSITRQSLVEFLLNLADRWDEIMLIRDDLMDALELAQGNSSIPPSLVTQTHDLLQRLLPVFHRRTEFLRVVGQEIFFLNILELDGEIPSSWRHHPFRLKLKALLPQPTRIGGLRSFKLASYPDSLPRYGDEHGFSDWIFRAASLISSNWTLWCNRYDDTPPNLLEDAKAAVDQWQSLLPPASPSDRFARMIVRYKLDRPAPAAELQRRELLCNMTSIAANGARKR